MISEHCIRAPAACSGWSGNGLRIADYRVPSEQALRRVGDALVFSRAAF